jgi:hypothetical protein
LLPGLYRFLRQIQATPVKRPEYTFLDNPEIDE